jgi:hypothetical protein
VIVLPALSVRHPYAWAIVRGFKPVENRDRATSFRGDFFIHAGKTEEKESVRDVLELISGLTGIDATTHAADYRNEAVRGAVVGKGKIADCVADHGSVWFSGTFGFIIENATPIAPVPCRGPFGFFRPPPLTSWQKYPDR